MYAASAERSQPCADSRDFISLRKSRCHWPTTATPCASSCVRSSATAKIRMATASRTRPRPSSSDNFHRLTFGAGAEIRRRFWSCPAIVVLEHTQRDQRPVGIFSYHCLRAYEAFLALLDHPSLLSVMRHRATPSQFEITKAPVFAVGLLFLGPQPPAGAFFKPLAGESTCAMATASATATSTATATPTGNRDCDGDRHHTVTARLI